MKNIKINIQVILVVLLIIPTISIAQQLPQFTQYMFNTISINPAYAGSREALNITALNRNQWVGLNGAPVTQTVSMHTPLRNEKIGIGLSFINDELGFENFTYIYGDFSYTVQTGLNTKLALGLKGGFTSYSLDDRIMSDPSVAADPFFSDDISRWNPNFGLGAFWHSDRWYLGLSAPRIINHDLNENNAFKAAERVQYYFTGGYVFDLNKDFKFKPSYLIKATNGAPLSYDMTAMFLYREVFWFGANYRIDDAVGFLVDLQISKQFRIGYAYDYTISDVRNTFTNGSHEFLLIYEFKFDKSKIKSPRYF